MTKRPIIFSAPMVRAILSGAKTQTRRIIDERMFIAFEDEDRRPIPQSDPRFGEAAMEWARCPYGAPGDRLWVRETWWIYDEIALANRELDGLLYRADQSSEEERAERAARRLAGSADPRDHWRSPIHMPRWASRITLEVTGVRVERLQEISESDARAEGAARAHDTDRELDQWARWTRRLDPDAVVGTHRGAFAALWERLHGAGSWASNPWVWVIEFRRAETASHADRASATA